MTHSELSRKCALDSVDELMAALEKYQQREVRPRVKAHFFETRSGKFFIRESPDLPPSLCSDLKTLKKALKAERANDVKTILGRLFDTEYPAPRSANPNYLGLFEEMHVRSSEYAKYSEVEVSGLDNKRSEKPGKPRIGGEDRALGVLAAHPGWPVSKIAEVAGLNRTTVYRYPRFIKARAQLKAKPPRNDRRRGRTGKRITDTLGDTSDEETLK